MKKLFSTVIATGTIFLGLSVAAHAATTADIVFLVDESGSMSGEHSWIGNMVNSLDTELIAAGVTGNRYALVGFGASSSHGIAGHEHAVGGSTWGTAADLAAASAGLVISGGTEDGYSAMHYATSNFSFRGGAAVNYILITDEDRDNYDTSLNYTNILAELSRKNIMLNAVADARYRDDAGNTGVVGVDGDAAKNWFKVDGAGGFTTGTGGYAYTGSGTTVNDYINMAWATGGAGWDLNILRNGGNDAVSFTKAFVDIKVGEIIIQPPSAVPEPTTMLLFGSGLIGLAAMSRRRSTK